MKLPIIITLVAASVLPSVAQDTLPKLSLDQCLAIALDKSPTIKVADMEVTRADYSKKETLSQLLPTVDFGGQYSRTLAKQVMYMNMSGLGGFGGDDKDNGGTPASRASSGGSQAGIKMGRDNSWSMGFSASVPVIAPQLWQSLALSDTQIEKNLETALKSRRELVNQVKSAYYTLLLAHDSRRTIIESYDMASFTHDIYTKKFALGAASDYDVLRTSVAMKNIEPEMIQADIAVKQAMLQLQILMGVDSSFAFEPDVTLSNYENDMYANTMSLDSGYAGNADLRLLDIDAKTLDKTITLRKLAYTPTVALSANYNWTSMNDGNPFRNLMWNPYSTVGVSFSMPIFSGGKRYSALRQAKIQAEELQLQRENLDRSIAMQVSLAIDNIKMNVKQIASASESVGQADRAHSIMEQSFAIGAASYLDLRDSELSLTRARLGYYQAIYNYLVACSSLELLQGTANIDQYTAK